MRKQDIYKNAGKNLEKCLEITALAIELRKAVLKKKYKHSSDKELTSMVFHEYVMNKERKWNP